MIHSTAIIHPNARIAQDAEIGPYTIVGDGAVISAGCRVGAHAVIEHAELGNNCTIFSQAAVGTAPQDLKYRNEPTKLVMGDNCMVREFVTLNRGTAAHGKTIIGSNCLFMAYTHVAHDCSVGNNVIMANLATLGGHVEVGDYAFLGGNAMVHQFCKIGKLSMLGGGAKVSLDILPYTRAQGDRAKLRGLNIVGMKRCNLTTQAIQEVKTAYHTLFLAGNTMEEALDQLEALGTGTELREFIDFIHASKRGICRPSKQKTDEE
jgi:UDP-N-acetylglucosamine acyltransferase